MFDISRLPQAFKSRMEQQLGDGYSLFQKSLMLDSPTSVRLNPRKRNGFPDLPLVAWSEHGRYLEDRPVFTLDPFFHSGAYYVQEASSMFLEQAMKQHVDLSQVHKVLDLCAAPGGKSTHLISLLSPDSLLVSNEVIRSRASILVENLQKWGYPNSIVTNSDPAVFSQLGSFFDVMVVDAPCSGEGLFRKDPDSMREWSPDHVQLCSRRQRRILSDVWPALREGGLLIYSTCTYNQDENEENLKWLSSQQEAEYLPVTLDPAWGVTESVEGTIRGYRFYPHACHGEGFFLSVIRKLGRGQELRSKKKTTPELLNKQLLSKVSAWIADAGPFAFLQRTNDISIFPHDQVQNLNLLAQYVHIMNAGTMLGTIKHDKIIPNHALALSAAINQQAFPTYALSKEESLQYLRKDTLSIAPENPGFTLACYQGQPLGWMNVLNNRINNLYPSEWRIRMAL